MSTATIDVTMNDVQTARAPRTSAERIMRGLKEVFLQQRFGARWCAREGHSPHEQPRANIMLHGEPLCDACAEQELADR